MIEWLLKYLYKMFISAWAVSYLHFLLAGVQRAWKHWGVVTPARATHTGVSWSVSSMRPSLHVGVSLAGIKMSLVQNIKLYFRDW